MDAEEFRGKLRGSNRTKDLYAQNIRRYLAFVSQDGKEENSDSAQAWLDHLDETGRAQNTVATAANSLRAFFKAKKEPLALDAPGVAITEPKYLTMPEFYRLVGAAKSPLASAMITMLFDTGCRISEILGVTQDDIDWEGRFIHVVRKGGRRADVNMEKGFEALRLWLDTRKDKKSRKVFVDLTYHDIRKLLMEIAQSAKIDGFTIHKLRHTRAVQMLSAGLTLHDVQQALGHQSIATTANIYGRLRPADLKLRLEKASW